MSLTDYDEIQERGDLLARQARERAPLDQAAEIADADYPVPINGGWMGSLGDAVVGTVRAVSGFIEDVSDPEFDAGSMIESQWNADRFASGISADSNAMLDAYDPVITALNRARPKDRQIPNPYLDYTADPQAFMVPMIGGAQFGVMQAQGTQAAVRQAAGVPVLRDDLENYIWDEVARMRKADPGSFANLPATRAEFLTKMREHQRALLDEAGELAGRFPYAAGVFQGIGGFGARADEPVNLLAIGLGGGGSASLLRTFLLNGAVNTAADAATLPWEASQRAALDRPMSGEEIVTRLGADFAVGGGLPVAAHIAARGAGAGYRALADAFDRRFSRETQGPTARTARTVVEDLANVADDNPYSDTIDGEARYRDDLQQAMGAADAGRFDAMPQAEPAALERARSPEYQAQRAGGIEEFDPRALTTDAAAMQYKGGADEAGVTQRLRGVERWDPVKAGTVLVWERNDGTLVVADGHQRRGLAVRALEAGQENVRLAGYRFREADGFTARQMRVVAALKNIAEGSGAAVDAARVLREAPERVRELPPADPLVRQAQRLMALSDDAWGMVVNGFVSERDGAVVGGLVKEPALQAAILDYLSKQGAETLEEAELIVRQALAAGAKSEVQTDMFGAMLKADLILPERVAILKSALSQLRRDKALFNTLTNRETAIAEAGNVLAPAENARRREAANALFGTIKALAERKGTISDALQKSAEGAAATGDRRTATKGFLAAVRDAMERGELDRADDGAAGGHAEPAGQDAENIRAERTVEEAGTERLELFADPKGKPEAFDQQRADLARELTPEQLEIPGSEASARQLAAAREAEGKGRKAAGAEQKDADKGLFAPKRDDEPGLFDEQRDEKLKAEFGDAAPEIKALRAMDGKEEIAPPDELGLGERTTLDEARAEVERDARAVERLRKCLGEGG